MDTKEHEEMKCCLCRKKVTEEECSKDFTVAVCRPCAREGNHYGWN